MSCPYYWYDYGYACRKTGKNVNDDIYWKYCRNECYDYETCPIYKAEDSSNSSSCYLTTACIVAMGLPDECHELSTLRRFRDNYMTPDRNMRADLKHYYEVAPKIVAAINRSTNAASIWRELFSSLVRPCVSMIENGSLSECYRHYKEYATQLEKRYLG